ncbi:DUF1684 domain-containing protein [Acidobacteria bacterium AB60]|nr:DUF1684 domain-containing protein [Acidobacteria bacterium AB60]
MTTQYAEVRLSQKCAAVLSALLVCGAVMSPSRAQTPASSTPSGPETAWRNKIQDWRAQREKEIAAPDGWLSLIALDWLKPGVNSFGSAPDNLVRIYAKAPEHMGLLTVSGKTVQLLAPSGGFPSDLLLDGKPVREGTLSADEASPSTLSWHGLNVIVLPRGSRYALRVKDADAPARAQFHGLNWYAPDLHFAVEARWLPYNPPHTLKIATVIGTTLDLPAPGIAEFSLNGKTLRLEPVLESPQDKTLFFILRDQTSQSTTYQAGRFLRAAFPDHGLNAPGTLVLDFNQLYNPPCAYTPYATCPLPPDQNRLPIALEAGEQRYNAGEHQAAR